MPLNEKKALSLARHILRAIPQVEEPENGLYTVGLEIIRYVDCWALRKDAEELLKEAKG